MTESWKNDLRLIESGFPCHQVGAETQRERGASSALPPLYFLHVWWARRPLTPSRAAILASLLPADTDPLLLNNSVYLAHYFPERQEDYLQLQKLVNSLNQNVKNRRAKAH